MAKTRRATLNANSRQSRTSLDCALSAILEMAESAIELRDTAKTQRAQHAAKHILAMAESAKIHISTVRSLQ